MTRNFVYEGVREVLIDVGAGSITVEAGARPDTIEGSVNVTGDAGLDDISIRQDSEQLRIWVPPTLARSTPVHLRLEAPPGLSYHLRAGSAMITCAVDTERAKISTGRGSQRPAGRRTRLQHRVGQHRRGSLDSRGGRLSTGAGDVRVGWLAPGERQVRSGDIAIVPEGCGSSARSGSGDIAVPSAAVGRSSLRVGLADRRRRRNLPVWLACTQRGAVSIAWRQHEPGPASRTSRSGPHRLGEIAVYRAS